MDDATAVRACRAGDVDAFRHLVNRYQGRALAHARILTRNEADAADATQEALVDAFRNLTGFDPTRPFYAWFYVLLRNRCFKQRSRRGTRSESGIVPEVGVGPGVSAEHLDLWRAIGRLPPDDARADRPQAHRGMDVRGTVDSAARATRHRHEPFVRSTAAAAGDAFRRATVNISIECERLRLQRMAVAGRRGRCVG